MSFLLLRPWWNRQPGVHDDLVLPRFTKVDEDYWIPPRYAAYLPPRQGFIADEDVLPNFINVVAFDDDGVFTWQFSQSWSARSQYANEDIGSQLLIDEDGDYRLRPWPSAWQTVQLVDADIPQQTATFPRNRNSYLGTRVGGRIAA